MASVPTAAAAVSQARVAAALSGAEVVFSRVWAPLSEAVGGQSHLCRGLAPTAAAALSHVELTSTDGWLPRSQHPVAALAGGLQAAVASAAVQLHHARVGRSGDSKVPSATAAHAAAAAAASSRARLDVRHACAEFMSERVLSVNGGRDTPPTWDVIAGNYSASGGSALVRLHTNFAHHQAAALEALGVAPRHAGEADGAFRGRVAAALEAASDADEVVERVVAAGGVASRLRTAVEWEAHPQGQAVASLPLIERLDIDDGEAHEQQQHPDPLEKLPGLVSERSAPLEGVRVLDMTRVIAGPVAGRTLAALGADVLRVSGPAEVPHVPLGVLDTNRGKRTACLDVRTAAGREHLLKLARTAHVVLLATRPGALGARDCGADALRAANPALTVIELSAYGRQGPWKERRGFDSIVQVATGIHDDEGGQALPMQALDHGAGTLMAATAIAGLLAGRGGHYATSLAQMAHFLRALRREGVGVTGDSTSAIEEEDEKALADHFSAFLIHNYRAHLCTTTGAQEDADQAAADDSSIVGVAAGDRGDGTPPPARTTRQVPMRGVTPAIQLDTARLPDPPTQLETLPLGFHAPEWLD